MTTIQRRVRRGARLGRVRKRRPVGLIVMTALVPTIGHQYTIEVAANYMNEKFGELHVVVNDRTIEPVSGTLRSSAIAEQFAHMPWVKVVNHLDDRAPLEDDGTQEFWDYWIKLAKLATGQDDFTHVFTSEPYGKPYAAQLNADFIPVDIAREVFHTKGTDVRKALLSRWNEVLPQFRKHLARRIVFFGADSCGKTTTARKFASEDYGFGGTFLPEWARPYLECVGTEVTTERMDNIILGQLSTQKAVTSSIPSPWIYQDTDLLTTLGYHRIYNMQPTMGMGYLEHLVRQNLGHLYIVMNSGIPFEPDPLRYGDGKRESTTEWWIDLLKEFGCHYYVVQSTGRAEQMKEIGDVIAAYQAETFRSISDFVRD